MNGSHLVHDIQLGHVCARIWSDDDSLQGKLQVTLHRLNKEGLHWTDADHFDIDDLPVLSEVLDLAHLWICEQQLVIA